METCTTAKLSTGALAAIAAAASSDANAIDRAAAPQPAPVTNWQGFYGGASVGASWLRSVQDDAAAVNGMTINPAEGFGVGSVAGGGSTTARAFGLLGGLQLGYNWQHGNFVYGMEGDFSWLGGTASSAGAAAATLTKGSKTFPGIGRGTTSRSSRVNALATFRGRFGWDFSGTMPYFTLGVAWGRTRNTWSFASGPFTPSFEFIGGFPATAVAATSTSWVPGVVLGGGVEHQLSKQWTLRGELMWVGFEGRNLNPLFSPGYRQFGVNGAPVKFSNDLVLVKAGLNYRF
jgi:outer membrane immunogenic protein